MIIVYLNKHVWAKSGLFIRLKKMFLSFFVMEEKEFKEIEEKIKRFGWFFLGGEFECPGLKKENLRFYLKHHKLPSFCDKCYKALIFWEDHYSKENLEKFFKMMNSFEIEHEGKFNRRIAAFHFRDNKKMLHFLEHLEKKMQEFGVKGITQWRRSCKAYQDLKPELWENEMEFMPDTEKIGEHNLYT